MTNEELNNQINQQFEIVRNAVSKRFNANCKVGFEIDGERKVEFTGEGWEIESPVQRITVSPTVSREVGKLCALLEQGEYDSFTIRLKWALNGTWLLLGKHVQPNHFGFSYSGYTKAFFAKKALTAQSH